jgi:hypothetical protein
MCGRPTTRARRQRLHLRPTDIRPELAQPLDHAAGTGQPGADDHGAFGVQLGARRDPVGEHVHAVALQPARQLHAGHQREARRQGPARLGVAGQGVVIGERDDVEAGLPGPAHHLRRGIGPVRGGAVGVEVDAHERSC